MLYDATKIAVKEIKKQYICIFLVYEYRTVAERQHWLASQEGWEVGILLTTNIPLSATYDSILFYGRQY